MSIPHPKKYSAPELRRPKVTALIQKILKKRNWTLQALSRHMGVSWFTVYRWSRDQSRPNPLSYEKLASFAQWDLWVKGSASDQSISVLLEAVTALGAKINDVQKKMLEVENKVDLVIKQQNKVSRSAVRLRKK